MTGRDAWSQIRARSPRPATFTAGVMKVLRRDPASG